MAEEPVYITLEKGAEMPARLPDLEKQLRDCFNANIFNITLDMENINLGNISGEKNGRGNKINKFECFNSK